MDKAILVTLVATVIAIGGVAAYFYLGDEEEELRDVDYDISAYCYTPGEYTIIVTLHSYQDEISKGDLYIAPSKTLDRTLLFTEGVATFTEEDEESTEVGPLIPSYFLHVEIKGFNSHRVYI